VTERCIYRTLGYVTLALEWLCYLAWLARTVLSYLNGAFGVRLNFVFFDSRHDESTLPDIRRPAHSPAHRATHASPDLFLYCRQSEECT
jgi:hypothetical protein